jgi:xylan 1,4-beta-xylosidase
MCAFVRVRAVATAGLRRLIAIGGGAEMTSAIRNPILRGFDPDPSICRVGEDYYIAMSTFEWRPGVQIHHSRDLVNWRLVRRPLDRAAQLDMRGNPDSCGVWAPCLSHSGLGVRSH